MDLREKSSVKIFLRPVAETDRQENEPQPDEEDHTDKALRTAEAHKRRRISASKYRSTKHVSPTSNVVERANSQAKLIMTDKRERLAPETLDMLMILKHNKSL